MTGVQQLLRRRDAAVEPVAFDTNHAVFAMVAGSVLALWAINRGFRGFTVSA